MENIFDTIERKPFLTIIGLLAFHIVIACLMSWIAHTSFLSHLHDGTAFLAHLQDRTGQPALWNFARDSFLYHNETIHFIKALDSGNWDKWWSGEFDSITILKSHIHVKWIALLYWLAGEENPLLFEIVNSVAWVASVVLIFITTRLLFQQNKIIAYLATASFFFPSFLLSSTQLLRDPLYILGFCLTIFGWVALRHKDSQWKGVFSIIIGFYLVTAVRPYTGPIMTISFFACTIIFILRKKIALIPTAIMLLGILVVVFQSDPLTTTHSTSPDKNKKTTASLATQKIVPSLQDFVQDVWLTTKDPPKEVARSNSDGANKKNVSVKKDRVERLIIFINKYLVFRINHIRHAFKQTEASASGIDVDVQFINIRDLISYLPRAFQIGLLSPFPNQWISSGAETGSIGRAIAGLETLIIYAVLIGFISAFFIEMEIFKPLAPVLIFSGIIIVSLGFTIPIAGAIYRMRQGLFIPIFILGVYGLQIIFIKIKSAIGKKGTHITG